MAWRGRPLPRFDVVKGRTVGDGIDPAGPLAFNTAMNALRPLTPGWALVVLAGIAACGGAPPEQVTNGLQRVPTAGNETGQVVQRATQAGAPRRAFEAVKATTDVTLPSDDEGPPPPLAFPLPIVLVHGFSGFSDLGPLQYFYGILDEFHDAGLEAFAPNQPPYSAVHDRALVLANHLDQILDDTGAEKVHLICHSQGGLDCRYLVSQLGYDNRVFDIITIATPHRGTPLADMAADAPDGVVNPAGLFMGWLFGLLEGDPPDQSAWDNDQTSEEVWAADMVSAVSSMTEEGTALFNAMVPDHENVPVFSVAAYSNLLGPQDLCDDGLLFDDTSKVDSLDPLLIAPALSISGLSLRRNDGIVPTDSMRWGTFLGCIPADHFDEVGQIADTLPNIVSGFDHRAFYWTLQAFLEEREQAYLAVAGPP